MPKPLPPPEPKPAALRLSARDVKFFLSSPAVVLVALVLAAAPGVVSVLVPQHTAAPPAPPVADSYAVDTRPALGVVTLSALTGLPAPDEQRQRQAPCDPDLETEFNGYCWVPIDVRPCPKGKTWEHQGKCYQRAMRVERPRQPPTSGDPQRAGIAGP